VAEAQAAGKPIAHHVTHLLLHGVLHLLGSDHVVKAEAVTMETLEIKILAQLGIPNPYQTQYNHA
jgi:probable rRNA maturation factor